MLPHDTSGRVVEDDELERLVYPAVLQPDRDSTDNVAVPESATVMNGIPGSRRVQSNDKGRRMNSINDFSVVRT